VARENLQRIPELLPVTDFVNSSIEEFETHEKFDLIYSIGTIGEYCEFNVQLVNKIASYLKPNGLFFFTIVDAESYVNREPVGIRKRLIRFALKLLPLKWRIKLDGKYLIINDFKKLFLSGAEVENILSNVKTPIKWELSKATDDLHVHHIVRVWLASASGNLRKVATNSIKILAGLNELVGASILN
jgi:SAM-dependent methyltransferase